jgi:hypothetical protein
MIHLDIDNMEKEDLREFLEHCLNFLRVEVGHADARVAPSVACVRGKTRRCSHLRLG